MEKGEVIATGFLVIKGKQVSTRGRNMDLGRHGRGRDISGFPSSRTIPGPFLTKENTQVSSS